MYKKSSLFKNNIGLCKFTKTNTMFHNIPREIIERMHYLESIDRKDRTDGTSRMQRLRQIPPETGRFISLLALTAPEGKFIEIGTSAGYSTLWLALACMQRRTKVTTYELLEEKQKLAEETIKFTGLENVIDLVKGDALNFIQNLNDISFCFLDAEKEIYSECYNLVIPKMKTGGILVADNAINHKDTLQPMIEFALVDNRVDALVVPVGKGELICRKS